MSDLNYEYSGYVVHPRYGRGPRFTEPLEVPGCLGSLFIPSQVSVHGRATPKVRIDGTAVVADRRKQAPAGSIVTHYFDEKRVCDSCRRPFIFFAEEQKFWYEELKFYLWCDCDQCTDCRKLNQGLTGAQRRYEELFQIAERTDDDNLEMAEMALELIAGDVFDVRMTEKVRMLLNQCPASPRSAAVREHLDEVEALVKSRASAKPMR